MTDAPCTVCQHGLHAGHLCAMWGCPCFGTGSRVQVQRGRCNFPACTEGRMRRIDWQGWRLDLCQPHWRWFGQASVDDLREAWPQMGGMLEPLEPRHGPPGQKGTNVGPKVWGDGRSTGLHYLPHAVEAWHAAAGPSVTRTAQPVTGILVMLPEEESETRAAPDHCGHCGGVVVRSWYQASCLICGRTATRLTV